MSLKSRYATKEDTVKKEESKSSWTPRDTVAVILVGCFWFIAMIILYTSKMPKDKKNKIALFGTILAVVLVSTLSLLPDNSNVDTPEPMRTNSTTTNEDMVMNSVADLKSETSFPVVEDEISTWTDVTAEGTAIRYHYELKGVDTTPFEDGSFRRSLVNSTCTDKDTRYDLSNGIGYQYQYTIRETGKQYLTTVREPDCL